MPRSTVALGIHSELHRISIFMPSYGVWTEYVRRNKVKLSDFFRVKFIWHMVSRLCISSGALDRWIMGSVKYSSWRTENLDVSVHRTLIITDLGVPCWLNNLAFSVNRWISMNDKLSWFWRTFKFLDKKRPFRKSNFRIKPERMIMNKWPLREHAGFRSPNYRSTSLGAKSGLQSWSGFLVFRTTSNLTQDCNTGQCQQNLGSFCAHRPVSRLTL